MDVQLYFLTWTRDKPPVHFKGPCTCDANCLLCPPEPPKTKTLCSDSLPFLLGKSPTAIAAPGSELLTGTLVSAQSNTKGHIAFVSTFSGPQIPRFGQDFL